MIAFSLPLDYDKLTQQPASSPEKSHWSNFYNQLQDEQWNEINFQEVQYAHDVDEWLMDKELQEVNLDDDNVETKMIGNLKL